MCWGCITHLAQLQAWLFWRNLGVIRKFPAQYSAVTLTRTSDSCSEQIRERSFHPAGWRDSEELEVMEQMWFGACHRHHCWHLSRPLTQTSKGQIRKEARQGQGRWKLQSGPLGSQLSRNSLGTIFLLSMIIKVIYAYHKNSYHRECP